MKEVEIAKKIEQEKGRLYLVGGAVRDGFLGKPIQDRDYCIIGMDPNKFQALFPQAKKIGKAFPVFELEQMEFAFARREKKIGQKHQDFSIQTGEDITIEQDLKRRDVTINAMAIDVLTGKIMDPYGGRKDIQDKVLRAVSDAFIQDPLRAYRVARLAAYLDFRVEEQTLQKIEQMKQELLFLPKERVFEEFRKALASNRPSAFFEIVRQANILEVHFKEIADLIGSLQPEKYHPEGDSFIHTMQVVDRSVKQTDKLEIRFSCLVHDLGKGTTPKEMYPHHYGHEERGVNLVEKLGKRIRCSKKVDSLWKSSSKRAHERGHF